MHWLAGCQLRDAQGQPIARDAIQCIEQIKGDSRSPKWVYHATLGKQQVHLKVRQYTHLRECFKAIRGKSNLANEIKHLELAGQAGFPTPKLIATGKATRFGVIVAQLLAVQWLENRVAMRYLLEDAFAKQDQVTIDALAQQAVQLLAKMRQANLADKDFGVHNLILPKEHHALSKQTPMWVDLERTYVSPAHHPQGSYESAGSLLSSWWLASGGHQPALEKLWHMIKQAIPQPQQGWQTHQVALNRYIRGKLAWHVQHQRIDRQPNAIATR